MINKFVYILSEEDDFQVSEAIRVNLNDPSQFRYTFWHPIGGRKHLYQTNYEFSSSALDLFYLSLMIFYADRTVSRKSQYDVWTRAFELFIPVRETELWEKNKLVLIDALKFLTGDKWIIHFRSLKSITSEEKRYKDGRHRFRKTTKHIDTETICMLSGGLDSFIGAIDLLKENKNLLFVSHYGGGKGVKKYQDNVITSLASHFNVDKDRFFRFYAAAQHGIEDSTRSRSLMFFSHAVAIASGMRHHVNLYIPENGVISLNIPLTVMRIGSLSTRTTHPYFMGLLQNLIHGLNLDISLINPFQYKTKGEMMMDCKDNNYLNSHYHMTLSCSHPDQGRWSGMEAGHCGECLPCTIRRAAINRAIGTDNSYYRHNYQTPSGIEALNSYKLGLLDKMDSYAAIQQSGPIQHNIESFVQLYERGIEEFENFIKTLR